MITPLDIKIILPALVLMLITFVVWLNMLLRRIAFIKSNNIDVENYPTSDALNRVLSERVQAPANCYRNLFEVPIIFYALTVFLVISSHVDTVFLNLAWAFVGLRALQACVHCTYNRVMHRFYAYLSSSVILCVMVLRFFLLLF